MKAQPDKGGAESVLVVGASFAGLSTAYRMSRLGYRVTVVEVADGLRRGGTPVDIRDRTVDVVKRMGLLEAIGSRSLPPRATEFKDAEDRTEARLPPQPVREDGTVDGYEVERDALLDILFEAVEGDVEVVFGTSATGLHDTENGVRASLAQGPDREFSLVFGCDGNHSAIRRMRFGPEAEHSRFLHQYFSISIVDEAIIEPNTTQAFNVPGRAVMLNSYEGKTDIVLSFHSDEEVSYDHRDQEQQRRIVMERFAGLGWRTPALLREVERSKSFYFDKLCQIRMPSCTKGRVALVGDAAYCASPAAGMGGSLAIIGAAALADAFEKHPGDAAAAFQAYDAGLRPFIDEVQADAVDFGLETFFPRTEEAIRLRNEQLVGLWS